MKHSIQVPTDLPTCVQTALNEDIQTGDVSAQLIPKEQTAIATIICREDAIICGLPYATHVFHEIDPSIQIEWTVNDGDTVHADSLLGTLSGNARALLTAERTALNFIQTLSGTATVTRQYVDTVAGSQTKLLDSRKTIPGLRTAQKYAVACGGGYNHRMGLFDAFLIKENHIQAAGGVAEAIQTARTLAPNLLLEIEVETDAELAEAIAAKPDRIMLDNFDIPALKRAVTEKPKEIEYEASGNITLDNLAQVAATDVDYISLGALTKHVKAIDLSMRFSNNP